MALRHSVTVLLRILFDLMAINFDLLKLQGDKCKAFEDLILEQGVFIHAEPGKPMDDCWSLYINESL